MSNKSCLALVLLLAMLHSGCVHASDDRTILERSIGKLILMSDSAYSYEYGENPFGDGPTGHEAVIIYETHIRNLPEKSKVDYFWALMWHFDLFLTSEGEIFRILILRDCGSAFLKKLERYIEKGEELQRDSGRLKKTKQFFLELKATQKSAWWKRLQSKGNYEDYIPVLKELKKESKKPEIDTPAK